MTIQQELISAVIGLILTLGGIGVIITRFDREIKAKEWNRKYGNTDFQNPYRN